MSETTPLEAVLKRDRVVVVAGLVGVIVLAWIYILLGAGMDMTAFEMTAASTSSGETPAGTSAGGAAGMAMEVMKPVPWTPGYGVLMVFMWWIMMVAMMLPSAAPMLLLFATVNRRMREQGAPFVPTGVFALGYVSAWGGFSVLAAGLQGSLERVALLSPMMASTSVIFGGGLLVAAGIYQLTPLKHACLRHCRSPLSFVTHHWRKGRGGAFKMGLEHGMFCLGCCWVLMALLFYGGVMNLYWIIGVALLVLLEKTLPIGHWVGFLMGIGLTAWGGTLIAVSL